jgi:hypothetical protein
MKLILLGPRRETHNLEKWELALYLDRRKILASQFSRATVVQGLYFHLREALPILYTNIWNGCMCVCVCIILHNDQVNVCTCRIINFSGQFLNRIIIVSGEYAPTITVFIWFGQFNCIWQIKIVIDLRFLNKYRKTASAFGCTKLSPMQWYTFVTFVCIAR